MVNAQLKNVINWLIAERRASSQRELAGLLGYNPSALSQIVNGKVPLSDKFVGKLTRFEPRINGEWVKSGKGTMLLYPDSYEEVVADNDDEEMEFCMENKYGAKFYKKGKRLFMTVRHVPYAAFGQFVNDSDRLDPYDDEWGEETYEVDRLARGNYLSFEVQGDSMDTGARSSFEAGDKVLVRELERTFWRDHIRFETHPYWVVVFGSSVLLKQMIGQDMERGLLTFHSLNPSPEYADFSICEDDIRGLYYVIRKKPKEVRI